MLYKCYGCQTYAATPLTWFRSPCMCTTTETVEAAQEPEAVQGTSSRTTASRTAPAK